MEIPAVINGTCYRVLGQLGRGMALHEATVPAQQHGLVEGESCADPSGADAAANLAVIIRAPEFSWRTISSAYQFSLARRSLSGDDNCLREYRPKGSEVVHKIANGTEQPDGRAAKLQASQARALDPLIDLILEHFIGSLPKDAAAIVLPWLETAEGRAAFRAKWPIVVEQYFEALRSCGH